MKEFKNKTTYIIGGSSGIGLATAKLLFEFGSKVIIFSRDERKLTNAATEIKKQSSACQNNIDWLKMDVANRVMVDQVIDIALERHGVPDILIKGMQKKQALIIPGFEGKFTGLAKRLVPSLVEWVMDRSIQKVQKSPKQKGKNNVRK